MKIKLLLKRFFALFNQPDNDPLDDLLIAKGLDPDQVLEDAEYARAQRGDRDSVNRMHDRWHKTKARCKRMNDNFRGVR